MATVTHQGLQVLYTRQQIADRVAEMGAQITHDLNGEKLVMIGVLKGAAPFLADLAVSYTHLKHPVRMRGLRRCVQMCIRDRVEQTLAQVNQAQNEAMMQVFRK